MIEVWEKFELVKQNGCGVEAESLTDDSREFVRKLLLKIGKRKLIKLKTMHIHNLSLKTNPLYLKKDRKY